MRVLLLIVSNWIGCAVTGQITGITDQFALGGIEQDDVRDVISFPDGGMLILGTSNSPISGNKTSPNIGAEDLWLIKLNPDLTIDWQQVYGGTGVERSEQIILLEDGNYLITCASNSPISGNKTVASNGDYDLWALKISVSGIILWQKSFGGLLEEIPVGVLELEDGTLIFGVTSKSDISGTKSEDTHGPSDYWIVKTTAGGSLIWDNTIGGEWYDTMSDLVLLNDSTIFLCGNSFSDAYFDKTEDSYGSSDIWAVKIDSSGVVIWDKSYGGNLGDNVNKVYLRDQQLFLVGFSESGISGTKTENCNGLYDFWIIKIDFNGDEFWQRAIGGSDLESAHRMTFTSKHQLLFYGGSLSGISGDKTEPAFGSTDYWIVSLDSNGYLLWDKTIGGDNYDLIDFIRIESNYDFTIVGTSMTDISDDKTVPSYGEADIWIIKGSTMLQNDNLKLYEPILYPNPSNGYIQFSEYVSQVRISNMKGQVIFELADNNSNKIEIDNLSSGMYYIEFVHNSKTYTKKLVVQ